MNLAILVTHPENHQGPAGDSTGPLAVGRNGEGGKEWVGN